MLAGVRKMFPARDSLRNLFPLPSDQALSLVCCTADNINRFQSFTDTTVQILAKI